MYPYFFVSSVQAVQSRFPNSEVFTGWNDEPVMPAANNTETTMTENHAASRASADGPFDGTGEGES
jgi:hypothetical protein